MEMNVQSGHDERGDGGGVRGDGEHDADVQPQWPYRNSLCPNDSHSSALSFHPAAAAAAGAEVELPGPYEGRLKIKLG